MIRVQRIDPPQLVYRNGGPAERERKRVDEHYKKYPFGSVDANGKRRAFKFAVYGHRAIKEALEAMFHGKCAYCETRYAASQPLDVEHWRPKAKVIEHGRPAMPGYYWLASDWDNLLPSCIDCNRERNQIIRPDGEDRLVGKANQFPIEGKRANSKSELAAELPLLLNPCDAQTDPADHLEFVERMAVRPKTIAGQTSELGQTSIDVYALNRSALVQERYERYLLIQKSIHVIERLGDILEQLIASENEADCRLTDIIDDLIGYEITALREYRKPDQPYSLMARQVIDRFFAERLQEKPARKHAVQG